MQETNQLQVPSHVLLKVKGVNEITWHSHYTIRVIRDTYTICEVPNLDA